MSDNHPVDPSGNTEAFRAFSSQPQEPARSSSNTPLIAGAAVVALALVALLIWLVVS
ncbi:hypothetical protein [Spirilliplanes yamanashiensis]|uniref:Uncharacterized protein n=1 Tax=Spirilliplanes yamanashiensis TaxID=42233 RepID=A0A8J3Y3M3_9ACTN|nr:hypothetical protein [Spirilliplanes yamanashiensis]MDP9820098.1 flagellar biogenesis protein FliO [Spirilliplanes yamanashiensis]GIJ01081.1 hypothetical protein Sya03_04330 [Spirilliplanes yamanashiensis]